MTVQKRCGTCSNRHRTQVKDKNGYYIEQWECLETGKVIRDLNQRRICAWYIHSSYYSVVRKLDPLAKQLSAISLNKPQRWF